VLVAALVLVTAGVGYWRLAPVHQPATPPRAAATQASQATVPAPATTLPSVQVATPTPAPPAVSLSPDTAGVTTEDLETAAELNQRLKQQQEIRIEDIVAAQNLQRRHPDQEPIRALFAAVLLTAGGQNQQQRRYDEAEQLMRRAAAVRADATEPRLALSNLLLEAGDWTGAEAAAREVLSLDSGHADALQMLGFALFRQDRNREAIDALDAALAVREDPMARALLQRIQKTLSDESGMKQQLISHFHVRYDGDAHEEVGREILRALERHYATLAVRLDHQPEASIPVILFTREGYYDASGAPAWSGGVYDSLDGRIRLPIGGLTASLTPDMDQTLIHEVTHAFIADRSRGVCPRDVHEGLAQYMEGKRLSEELTEEQITALADGRIGGVGGFYLAALSFVEYLIAIRSQGGINDLLRLMGETGNVDEAFRQVYGQDYRATKRRWMSRLRQRYGS
jgi:hypothetical protein